MSKQLLAKRLVKAAGLLMKQAHNEKAIEKLKDALKETCDGSYCIAYVQVLKRLKNNFAVVKIELYGEEGSEHNVSIVLPNVVKKLQVLGYDPKVISQRDAYVDIRIVCGYSDDPEDVKLAWIK